MIVGSAFKGFGSWGYPVFWAPFSDLVVASPQLLLQKQAHTGTQKSNSRNCSFQEPISLPGITADYQVAWHPRKHGFLLPGHKHGHPGAVMGPEMIVLCASHNRIGYITHALLNLICWWEALELAVMPTCILPSTLSLQHYSRYFLDDDHDILDGWGALETPKHSQA